MLKEATRLKQCILFHGLIDSCKNRVCNMKIRQNFIPLRGKLVGNLIIAFSLMLFSSWQCGAVEAESVKGNSYSCMCLSDDGHLIAKYWKFDYNNIFYECFSYDKWGTYIALGPFFFKLNSDFYQSFCGFTLGPLIFIWGGYIESYQFQCSGFVTGPEGPCH